MKNPFFVSVFFLFAACTKKVGHFQKPSEQSPALTPVNTCSYQTNSTISYSATIQPLILNNCGLTCHSTPGSGGINLDSFSAIKTACLSGQLLPVAINTDTNSTIMPPPPQRHLDSCELKALNLWILQGCVNN